MSEELKEIKRLYNVFKNENFYQLIIGTSDDYYYRWQSSEDTKILIKKTTKSVVGGSESYTNAFAYDLWENRTTATYEILF